MKNLTETIKLSKRIYFFLFLIISLIGGVAFFSINHSSEKFVAYREMAVDSNISKNLLTKLMFLRLQVKNFIQYQEIKYSEKFYSQLDEVEKSLTLAEVSIQNPDRARLLNEAKSLFQSYKLKFTELVELVNDLKNKNSELEALDRSIRTNLKNSGVSAEFENKYLNEVFLLVEAGRKNDKFNSSNLENLSKLILKSGNRNSNLLVGQITNLLKLSSDLAQINIKMEKVIHKGLDSIGPVIAKNLSDISDSIQQVQDRLGPELVRTNNISQNTILWVSLSSLLLCFFLVLNVFKYLGAITKQIVSLTNDIDGSSKELKDISYFNSKNSNIVAESSQEQASSLEETSSSLEEMDGMAKKNLKSVENNNDLTVKMKSISDQASDKVTTLVSSMEEISHSNQKIENLAQVISEIDRKTRLIDEIVSQTKILSFNASVEAERAGEHGKGFSVVAEEVGNLAKTSGEAAKEIQQIVGMSLKEVEDLIASNKKRVERGTHLTIETKEILNEINHFCDDVFSKNQEILNATNEQVEGIKQINIAVSELDKATQENTNVAEETTQSASKLEIQSKSLIQIVDSFKRIIGNHMHSSEVSISNQDPQASESMQILPFKVKSKAKEAKEEKPFENINKKKTVNDPWDEL